MRQHKKMPELRRPIIRQRPVTPARVVEQMKRTLPPPRVPVPRAPRRPVLQLVVEDTGAQPTAGALAQAAALSPEAPRGELWSRRRVAAAVAASLVLVVVAAMIGRQLASQRATAVSTVETTSGAMAAPMTPAAPTAAQPAVPVFDVNSLPPAPATLPARASR